MCRECVRREGPSPRVNVVNVCATCLGHETCVGWVSNACTTMWGWWVYTGMGMEVSGLCTRNMVGWKARDVLGGLRVRGTVRDQCQIMSAVNRADTIIAIRDNNNARGGSGVALRPKQFSLAKKDPISRRVRLLVIT